MAYKLSIKKKDFISPITRPQLLDASKLKEFADDNFRLDKNGRKLSKQVENTVGKGEIARYEQFLLFPQCFQKACFPGASKGVIVWEGLLRVFHWYFFNKQKIFLQPFPKRQILDSSKLKEFADYFRFYDKWRKFFRWVENTLGKGEIALYEQFLLFPVFSKDLYCKDVKTTWLVWVRVYDNVFKDFFFFFFRVTVTQTCLVGVSENISFSRTKMGLQNLIDHATNETGRLNPFPNNKFQTFPN